MVPSVGADEPVKTAALVRAEAQLAEITRDPSAYVIKVRSQRRKQERTESWLKLVHRTSRSKVVRAPRG